MKSSKKNIDLYKNNQGSVSVFIIMIFSIILIIFFSLIDAIRILSIKSHMTKSAYISLNSTLSGYNRELKDDYGLIAIRNLERYEIEDEIIKYMNLNIPKTSLDKYEDVEVNITSYKDLSDLNELERQIDVYINQRNIKIMSGKINNLLNFKESYDKSSKKQSLAFLEKIKPPSKEKYELIRGYEKNNKQDEVYDKINSIVRDDDKYEDDKEDDYERNKNDKAVPEKYLTLARTEGINSTCKMVSLEDVSNLSKAMIKPFTSNIKNNFNVVEYSFMKFGNRIKVKKGHFFDSEIEFLIAGFIKQSDNEKEIRRKTVTLLFPIKLSKVYQDPKKKEIATLTAECVAGWWATEIGVTIVKNLILTQMALDEANTDYESLLKNNSITISDSLNLKINYEDVLRILLYLEDKDIILRRIAFLIDINMKSYNEIFSIYSAKTSLVVDVRAKCKYLLVGKNKLLEKYNKESINIRQEISGGY